jgi:autotransporter-associated beta strand protein
MQTNARLALLAAAVTAVCGSLLATSTAYATQFWDGGGDPDNNWNTPANWGGDALPAFTTTAINFGSLSSAAGTAFGNVVVPPQTTANNDLTAGTLIKSINFGNNGQANRTDAYTLQGNSIVLGDVINNGIVTTGLAGSAIVSSIEDVIELDMDLGTAGTHRQIQTGAKHDLRIDGVISGGVNVGLLLRSTDSKITVTNANNSYLGFTNIAEGTASALGGLVEITSIDDGGSNSSIGASSNAATNLRFNSGFNDTSLTTLRYIGGDDASTDRLFALYGNITGTNSAIESSGDGTLSFTNTGAIVTSHQRARNFYLGGNNTGNNTFAPTLSNFTEVSTFTKQGAGKWILTGIHTYTGATTISEGTLALSGSGSIANSSQIVIGSGATLDITGLSGDFSLGSNQTLSGTGTLLATGKTIVASGTLSPGNSPGTATVNGGTLELQADANYNWQVFNASGAAGTGYDTTSLINGAVLDLSDLSSVNPYNINLWSLSAIGPDVNGDATGFDNTQIYNWTVFSQDSAISGFDEDFFQINVGANNGTSGFSNDLGGGNFTVSLNGGGNAIMLNFIPVPEPSTLALLAAVGGLAGIGCARRRTPR